MNLLRRLFGLPLDPAPRYRDLVERLDLLEADMTGLMKRVKKLQGIVTGGIRHAAEEESPDDAPPRTNGDRPHITNPLALAMLHKTWRDS